MLPSAARVPPAPGMSEGRSHAAVCCLSVTCYCLGGYVSVCSVVLLPYVVVMLLLSCYVGRVTV